MNSVNQIIEKIKFTSSTNDKIDILDQYKGFKLLKECLKLMLDDTLFYIQKIPKYEVSQSPTLSLEQALESLQLLSDRSYTGNEGIAHLSNILSNLDEDNSEVIKKIISKDPDCGIAATTVNKVWKDLVHIPPYMRCEVAGKLKYPCLSETKADGMFANVVCNDGKIVFLSRTGKIINLLGVLESEFEGESNSSTVKHGELLVLDEDGNILPRKTGNGLLNKAIKGTITEDICERVICKLWDEVPYNDWKNKKCNINNLDRFNTTIETVKRINSSKIQLTDYQISNNEDEANEFYKKQIELKLEGSIDKNFNGIWKHGTSKDCIKRKEEHDCDLICFGTNPHKKDKNLIGSLCCQSSDGKLKVNVSGLTDEQRGLDSSYFTGKIITVRFNEVIIDKKTKDYSLFLPRMVEFDRIDNGEPDSLDKILELVKGNK